MNKIIPLALGLVLIGGACSQRTSTSQTTNTQHDANTVTDQAIRDGKNLSAQRCTGTDKPKLTHLPMNSADVAMILPYGLMIGGHVTPVDHQYFSPKNFNSKTNAYPVYAMADSRIVGIGTRQHPYQGHDTSETVTDYRIVFTVSCKLLYYYDLVTGLAPDLKAAYDSQGNNIDFTVKSGQLIGYIGGQTLDFAVWDTDSNLTGFVVPDHYTGESWKIHTVDPLDYETDEVQAASLALYARAVEPRSGKIDYDIDGKAIGTWFQVGTGGYAGVTGNTGGDYWVGHLSLAPEYLVPSSWLISIGNWPGGASQFAAKESGPNPADIDVSTGLVKYTLVNYRQYENGSSWSGMSLPTSPLSLHKYTDQVQGCFLVQMLDTRSLKAEAFKGKPCSSVSGFDAQAVMYER